MSVLYGAFQNRLMEDREIAAHGGQLSRSFAIRVKTEEQFNDFWDATSLSSPKGHDFSRPYRTMYHECFDTYGDALALRVLCYSGVISEAGWCSVGWYRSNSRAEIFEYEEFLARYGLEEEFDQSDMDLSDFFSL